MTDEQLGRLFRAFCLYNRGEEFTIDEDIKMAFMFFKIQFDFNSRKTKEAPVPSRRGNPNFKQGKSNPYYAKHNSDNSEDNTDNSEDNTDNSKDNTDNSHEFSTSPTGQVYAQNDHSDKD
ncbi:MAG: DUF6291 domain-containing protein, partial [Prevotellaceae bacterium]|nr:DUF6291 domain-containing protein [Prevotellaceae bacterium]